MKNHITLHDVVAVKGRINEGLSAGYRLLDELHVRRLTGASRAAIALAQEQIENALVVGYENLGHVEIVGELLADQVEKGADALYADDLPENVVSLFN